jgi:putative spermidine/putrescine transport system permease protein
VLHTAFLILFLYTFGAFDIPYLLGESRPAMVAMRVYSLYFERDLANRPTAMALLVLMLLLAVAFIALYARASARLGAGERRL